MGYRRIIKQSRARQYLIRPTLTYSFNEIFAVAGAVAWFRTYSDNAPNLNEFRIQQDFNVRWPDLGFARLFFRARLEQRFFFYKNLPDDFDLRARFLGGAQTKDLTFLGERRPIYFKSLFEGFWTVTAEKAFAYSSSVAAKNINLHAVRESTIELISSVSLMILALPLKLNLSVATGFLKISCEMG